MTLIAFVMSQRFGYEVSDSKFVQKVCEVKRPRNRRDESQKAPVPVKKFENKYENRNWYDPVPRLDRFEALFYVCAAIPTVRGNMLRHMRA